MPGCGMYSRPKLADKARYNSLLKIKSTTTTTTTLGLGSPYHLGRVTLLVGLAVCLLKPCKSSRYGYPRRRAISVGLDMK